MKKKNLLIFLFIGLITFTACEREILDKKSGVSLPAVSNLALADGADSMVTLTWQMPTDIDPNILQPLNIYIEVKEEVSAYRVVPIFNTTLAGAPTSFDYKLEDPAKKYRFTVKVNGMVNSTDINYSNNIFSLGQTVVR
jgi:hypothetical protein